MRVVLDSNVVISASIETRGYPSAVVRAALAGRFEFVTSDHIMDEVERNVRLPCLMKRMPSDTTIETLSDRIRAAAEIVEPAVSTIGVSRDPGDDLVLGTAVAADAAYLVTGDDDLLTLGSYAGFQIVTPAQFVVVLEELEAS